MQEDDNIKPKLASMAQNLPAEQPELSPKQKAEAFIEWAESHRRDIPPLSDEAISRASIYSNERL